MNKRNYYYQKVINTEELDELQSNIENADKNIIKALFGAGIVSGMTVTNTLTGLTILPGIAFDDEGNHVRISNNVIRDLASVKPGSNKRYVSFAVKFKVVDSDQQTDGNGDPVFYKRDEGFEIVQYNSDIAASPILPTIQSNEILITDVLMNTSGIESVDYSRVLRLKDETKLVNLKKVIDAALADKEPVFNKNTAFNKNFGTTAGTVCQGNDSRLANSRKCNNTFDNEVTARSNLGIVSFSIVTNYGSISGSKTQTLNLPGNISNKTHRIFVSARGYLNHAHFRIDSVTIMDTSVVVSGYYTYVGGSIAISFDFLCISL